MRELELVQDDGTRRRLVESGTRALECPQTPPSDGLSPLSTEQKGRASNEILVESKSSYVRPRTTAALTLARNSVCVLFEAQIRFQTGRPPRARCWRGAFAELESRCPSKMQNHLRPVDVDANGTGKPVIGYADRVAVAFSAGGIRWIVKSSSSTFVL